MISTVCIKVRLLGAKRLVVLLPDSMEDSPDDSWCEAIEDRATTVYDVSRVSVDEPCLLADR